MSRRALSGKSALSMTSLSRSRGARARGGSTNSGTSGSASSAGAQTKQKPAQKLDPVIKAEGRVERKNLSTNFVDANILSATPLNYGQMRKSSRRVGAGGASQLVPTPGGSGVVGAPRMDVLRRLAEHDHTRSSLLFGTFLLSLGVVNFLLSMGMPIFNGEVLSAALQWAGDELQWLVAMLWRPPVLDHPWVGKGPAAQWAAWVAFSACVLFGFLASVQVRRRRVWRKRNSGLNRFFAFSAKVRWLTNALVLVRAVRRS